MRGTLVQEASGQAEALTIGAQSGLGASSLTNLISAPPGRFARLSFGHCGHESHSSSTAAIGPENCPYLRREIEDNRLGLRGLTWAR